MEVTRLAYVGEVTCGINVASQSSVLYRNFQLFYLVLTFQCRIFAGVEPDAER